MCKYRFVRYPIGVPTSAFSQTGEAAAVKVSYLVLTQLNNKNHNAELSLPKQTADYSQIGSRRLIVFIMKHGTMHCGEEYLRREGRCETDSVS